MTPMVCAARHQRTLAPRRSGQPPCIRRGVWPVRYAWLCALAVLTGIAPAPPLCAQAPAVTPSVAVATTPFAVAAIKEHRNPAFTRFSMQPGGRLSIVGASLQEMVRLAYGVRDFQIVNGPDWMAQVRFDIEAKADTDLGPLALPADITDRPSPAVAAWRALLTERFSLSFHVEERPTTYYALVLARSDGRLGPSLRRSATDCAALRAARAEAGGSALPPPPPPPRAGEIPQCANFGGVGRIAGGGMAIDNLMRSLSNQLERTIVNDTGLSGQFDYLLEFTPQQPARLAVSPDGAPPAPVDRPSVFAALEEQLGLKLETRRGPVQFLVVERAVHPSDN